MGDEKPKDPKADPNVRPFDNAFMQLKLKAMMPRHSPQLVVACTILVAVIFIPLGVTVILASDQIWEKEIRYDDIKNCKASNNDGVTSFLNTSQGVNNSQGCRVRLSFTVDQTIPQPIYMYYRIKGLHQNYRDYTDSINHDQIGGYSVTDSDAIENCWPFASPTEYPTTASTETITLADGSTTSLSKMRYNPCGAIAWSMFNDSFTLYKNTGTAAVDNTMVSLPTSVTNNVICDGRKFDSDGTAQVGAGDCTKRGIALSVDRESRFVTASRNNDDWTNFGNDGSNYYLTEGYYNQEPGHKVPLATDEDFMVWARPAAMPDFRKLYRIITKDLAAGDYVFDVNELYDTSSFNGEKYIILATTSWVGGENKVLGILFLAFGALSFVLAIVFFLVALVKKPVAAE